MRLVQEIYPLALLWIVTFDAHETLRVRKHPDSKMDKEIYLLYRFGYRFNQNILGELASVRGCIIGPEVPGQDQPGYSG